MNSAWILYGFFSVLKSIEKYGENIHAPFMHLFMHLFTYLFIHLFMYLFTHLFKRKVVFLFIHRVCEACQIDLLVRAWWGFDPLAIVVAIFAAVVVVVVLAAAVAV